MVQKDKELLLEDLCTRLPYGVKCAIFNKDLGFGGIPGFEGKYPFVIDGITQEGDDIDVWVERGNFSLESIKPYLFPLSSMTGEQYVEFVNLGNATSDDCFDGVNFNQLDWLIAHHFDYRGLIEKGLAIDATGKNVY